MEAKLRFDTITYSDLRHHLLQYPNHVPSSLAALDELRYITIPQTLAQRKSDGEPFLEKAELISLVDWKLKHGKYRPNLAKLVSSNTLAEVRKASKEAFEIYEDNSATFDKAVSKIAKLKGVGPATASLLLSCYDPIHVPFFSDELFRYLHWEEARNGGWNRKIGYTLKEYREVYDRSKALRERLRKEDGKTVSALDVEQMAYALAKGAHNGVIVSSSTTAEGNKQEEDNKVLKPPSPKRRKRTKTPDPPRSPSPTTICLNKGPRGSPTYDELGYELDFNTIARASSGKRRTVKQMEDQFEQERKESNRKARIMNIARSKQSAMTLMAQDDRVARDLGIAYHEVGMEEYEQWYKKGFRAEPGEFENIPKKEEDRICALATGSTFRKGSKH